MLNIPNSATVTATFDALLTAEAAKETAIKGLETLKALREAAESNDFFERGKGFAIVYAALESCKFAVKIAEQASIVANSLAEYAREGDNSIIKEDGVLRIAAYTKQTVFELTETKKAAEQAEALKAAFL